MKESKRILEEIEARKKNKVILEFFTDESDIPSAHSSDFPNYYKNPEDLQKK